MTKIFHLFLISTVLTLTASVSNAEVTGISSRESLLLQLKQTLGITDLPSDLKAKLPVRNDLEEITQSFLNSWTQLSFLACKEALRREDFFKVSSTATAEQDVRTWLTRLIESAQGRTPDSSEVGSLYTQIEIRQKQLSDQEAEKNEFTFASSLRRALNENCVLILTHPKVYLIFRPERKL